METTTQLLCKFIMNASKMGHLAMFRPNEFMMANIYAFFLKHRFDFKYLVVFRVAANSQSSLLLKLLSSTSGAWPWVRYKLPPAFSWFCFWAAGSQLASPVCPTLPAPETFSPLTSVRDSPREGALLVTWVFFLKQTNKMRLSAGVFCAVWLW